MALKHAPALWCCIRLLFRLQQSGECVDVTALLLNKPVPWKISNSVWLLQLRGLLLFSYLFPLEGKRKDFMQEGRKTRRIFNYNLPLASHVLFKTSVLRSSWAWRAMQSECRLGSAACSEPLSPHISLPLSPSLTSASPVSIASAQPCSLVCMWSTGWKCSVLVLDSTVLRFKHRFAVTSLLSALSPAGILLATAFTTILSHLFQAKVISSFLFCFLKLLYFTNKLRERPALIIMWFLHLFPPPTEGRVRQGELLHCSGRSHIERYHLFFLLPKRRWG